MYCLSGRCRTVHCRAQRPLKAYWSWRVSTMGQVRATMHCIGMVGVLGGVCKSGQNRAWCLCSFRLAKRRRWSITKRKTGCWNAHTPECKESSTALRFWMSSWNADMLCSKNRKLNLRGRKIEKSLFQVIVKERFIERKSFNMLFLFDIFLITALDLTPETYRIKSFPCVLRKTWN